MNALTVSFKNKHKYVAKNKCNRRDDLICTCCDKRNHTRNTCFKNEGLGGKWETTKAAAHVAHEVTSDYELAEEDF